MVSSLPPPRSHPGRRRRKILLVDDDPSVLRGVTRMLSRLSPHWEIVAVNNGFRAASLLRQEAFDVLVTDLNMPDVDGLALLRISATHHPEMLRVVHSSHAETANSEVFRLAQAILTKPVSGEMFVDTLEELMGARSWSRVSVY